MRNKERIEPFLRRLDLSYLMTLLKPAGERFTPEEFTKEVNFTQSAIDGTYKDLWMKLPDLRFGQLMYNNGFKWFNQIYYKEESEVLEMCGWKDVESTLWGSNYDSEGNPLDKTVFRFIDELDDKHLKTMIEEANFGKRMYPTRHILMFEKELANRGFTNIKMTTEGWVRQIDLNQSFEAKKTAEFFKTIKKSIKE